MQLGWTQQKTITGTITNENGLPLPGATAILEGNTQGVATDFDGHFSIQAATGDVLVASYVGYADQRLTVDAQDNYSLTLLPDNALEEVVVTTAYGEQRKSAIDGSINTITNDLIENVQSTSIIGAIQGSIQGVNILTQGGVPGTNPVLWIRGTSSINADPNPLYIVDGVPYNGNINNISSPQIESISVLKDASATALYGARGANGVVLLNTRRGKLNLEPKVTLNSTVGINSNAIKMHETLNNQEYMELTWEAIKNNKVYSEQKIESVAAQEASNELIGHLGYNPFGVENPVDTDGNLVSNARELWNTDWQKQLLRNTGMRSEHSLSIVGGGEKTSYFSNLNYLKEEGQVKTTFFERISARLTQDTQVNDLLKFGSTLSYTTSQQGVPDQEGTAIASQFIQQVLYPQESTNTNINTPNSDIFETLWIFN